MPSLRISNLDRLLAPRRWVLALGLAASLANTAPADTARYRVRFESTWSAETHPTEFPSSPHFSGLVGGTHSGEARFWESGGFATPGIRAMAERGSKSPLTTEVQEAIDAGRAGAILSGPGIGRSPGAAEVEFEVSEEYPLVTIVSMIAPSPDWFVGVSALSLRRDDAWVEHLVVPLHGYDAGTDSGETYRSPNEETSPPEPIVRITNAPLGDTVIGTFEFSRLDPPPHSFRRGEVNGDEEVNIADAIAALGALFGSDRIGCRRAADVNDDGKFNIADPIALLNTLFSDSFVIPPPAASCGLDPTVDDLDCEASCA